MFSNVHDIPQLAWPPMAPPEPPLHQPSGWHGDTDHHGPSESPGLTLEPLSRNTHTPIHANAVPGNVWRPCPIPSVSQKPWLNVCWGSGWCWRDLGPPPLSSGAQVTWVVLICISWRKWNFFPPRCKKCVGPEESLFPCRHS